MPQTYSLFEVEAGGYLIRHWKVDDDGKRRSTKYLLEASDVEPILKRILQLDLPVAPAFDTGCDGGYTELEIGEYWCKSIFRWWSVPPRGWEVLDDLTYELLRLVENFDDSASNTEI